MTTESRAAQVHGTEGRAEPGDKATGSISHFFEYGR